MKASQMSQKCYAGFLMPQKCFKSFSVFQQCFERFSISQKCYEGFSKVSGGITKQCRVLKCLFFL